MPPPFYKIAKSILLVWPYSRWNRWVWFWCSRLKSRFDEARLKIAFYMTFRMALYSSRRYPWILGGINPHLQPASSKRRTKCSSTCSVQRHRNCPGGLRNICVLRYHTLRPCDGYRSLWCDHVRVLRFTDFTLIDFESESSFHCDFHLLHWRSKSAFLTTD